VRIASPQWAPLFKASQAAGIKRTRPKGIGEADSVKLKAGVGSGISRPTAVARLMDVSRGSPVI
jgi:hypothetical protein